MSFKTDNIRMLTKLNTLLIQREIKSNLLKMFKGYVHKQREMVMSSCLKLIGRENVS